MRNNDFIIIMGVSGSGKSTIGRGLARGLSRPFVEGDDYHPLANIHKMASGTPLSDLDRRPWTAALCDAAIAAGPCVIACSALTQPVRKWLKDGLPQTPTFLWLDVSEAALRSRLARRMGHFMPLALLESQLAALDPPGDAIVLKADGRAAEELVNEALSVLR